MSKEKLQAFAEAVSKSEELQKQLAEIQVKIAKSTAEKVAKLSESAGTPFTAEEYLQSVAESSEQMSNEQLQTVAGGWGNPASVGFAIGSIITLGIGCLLTAIASAQNPSEVACEGLK
jgi:predicted ribosomally synthesized peptide with nif11-like leader